LTLGLRLVVSAMSLGIAVVAGIIAVAALSGQPDNTQATNIEIGLVAAAVCVLALAALVTVWRK
jgi:hypothetical protein